MSLGFGLVIFICFILFQGYHGAAVGKGRQLAKTELEKLKLPELSTREAVIEAARMFVFNLACHVLIMSLIVT